MLKVAKLEVVDEPRTLPPESESHLNGTVREVALAAWKDGQNLPGVRKQQEGSLVLGQTQGGWEESAGNAGKEGSRGPWGVFSQGGPWTECHSESKLKSKAAVT